MVANFGSKGRKTVCLVCNCRLVCFSPSQRGRTNTSVSRFWLLCPFSVPPLSLVLFPEVPLFRRTGGSVRSRECLAGGCPSGYLLLYHGFGITDLQLADYVSAAGPSPACPPAPHGMVLQAAAKQHLDQSCGCRCTGL